MKTIANIFIYLAGIIWGIELIPQLIKTIRKRSVADISLGFFSLCLFAYILYIIGNMILKNYNIVIAHIPSLISNCIMVLLILKFKSK